MLKCLIGRHQNSSPTPINDLLDKLLKGAETIAHFATLQKSEVQALRKANEDKDRRQRQKKKFLRRGGTLTALEGQEILDQAAIDIQISLEKGHGEVLSRSAGKKQRHCGNCGGRGHNARTCTEG